MSKFTDSNTSYSALEESYINLTKRPDSTRTDYQTVLVFHCGMCNTIWGDSLGVCGEEKQLNSVIFLRVSKDVVVKDELEFRLQGQMAGCAYKALHCSGCQCFVGIVPYSTPKHLSALRNLFLMQKENINCYSLGNGSMVKASSLHFDQSTASKGIDELRQEMGVLKESLTALEKRLKLASCGKEG